VKHAFRRQRDVHDLRKIHFENRQEQFHARAADVKIFHRRDADDGGGINGVLAVRDGGDVEDGIAEWRMRNAGMETGVPG
jgi:hypothetical protein